MAHSVEYSLKKAKNMLRKELAKQKKSGQFSWLFQEMSEQRPALHPATS